MHTIFNTWSKTFCLYQAVYPFHKKTSLSPGFMLPNKTNDPSFQANRSAIQNTPLRSADPQAYSVSELLHI